MVATPNFDLDIDTTLGGNNASDYVIPSQKAIKSYVDNSTGGNVMWGNITGTLSNQTDLQSALDDKQDILTAGTDLEIIQGSVVPSEYTELQSVSGVTNAACIDTGIAGNNNNLRFKFTASKSRFVGYASLIGNYYDENSNVTRIIAGGSATAGVIAEINRKSGNSTVTNTVDITAEHEYELYKESGVSVFKVDGVIVEQMANSSGTDNSRNIAINSSSVRTTATTSTATTTFKGHFYIWDGATLIREYVPAKRNSDNKVGFYDLVNDTFNPSMFDDYQFTAGADVPSATIYFTNESGYITASALNGYATEQWVTNQNYVNSTTLTNTLANYALTSSLAEVATSGDYDDLINKPTIPSAVTESTVSGWGFTKNIGTVTSVNNVQPVNGNVTLSIPDTSNLANKDLSNLSSTGNAKFQAPLVSGTNIKTINNNSILGSGNLTLDGLPDQTGYTDAVLLTDGTDASWNETGEIYPVIETYQNGTSWYRVYSDGWCEQGGLSVNVSSGSVTVNLLLNYNNINYSILTTAKYNGTSVAYDSHVGDINTSSFKIYSNESVSHPVVWQACGYIEV